MTVRHALNAFYGVYAACVIALVIFVITCPLVILGPTLNVRRAIGRAGVRLSLALIGVRFRIRGLERLPAGPCIVASNHASYLDGLVLTAALPSRFTFVVQDGAANWPYVGWVIRRMGVTFINRTNPRQGSQQTRSLIRRLRAGEPLALFPEGTFARAPGLLPFKSGAFLMAARAGVPVVPAAIRGTRRLLAEGQWLPRRSAVCIEILEPFMPDGTDRIAAQALRDRTRHAVLTHCGEPDSAIA